MLTRAEDVLARRRGAEVEDLLLALAWADLHAADPRTGPGGTRTWIGQDRLVGLGGEGTPWVQELCLPELGVARQVHTLAARALLADALDLRHRLPTTWAMVQTGEVEVWVARRVATLSRALDAVAVGLVDTAVAEALATLSPSRVLNLAEAAVIEADTAAYEAKLDERLRRRLVAIGRVDDHGSRSLFARMEAGEAAFVDEMVDRVADLLAARPHLTRDLPAGVGKDELRSVALGWLAHPEAVLDLLDGALDTDPGADTPDAPGSPADAVTTPARRRRPRSTVQVYLHLHQDALRNTPTGTTGTTGVVRPESGAGLPPLLTNRLHALVRHAQVVIRPVIDLHATGTADSYEFPATITERVHLRSPAEAFPHGSRLSRKVDLDHVVPFDPGGPPGQSGDHNVAKLARTHHRAKTHTGHGLAQVDLDHYLWRTPHGLHRAVGDDGTHVLDVAPGLRPSTPRRTRHRPGPPA